MKLFFKILLLIFTMIITTVGEVKSYTVTEISQEEMLVPFFQEVHTDDGSNDIVMVPDEQIAAFKKHIRFTDRGILNSTGWNDYWKDEFGLAETQFNDDQITILNMFNSTWSRNRAVDFMLNPTFGNSLMMSLSESLSQLANPELVVKGLSFGMMGTSLLNAAKGGTKALRKVGSILESVDDVFANPNLLKGQTPAQVQGMLGKTPGWQVETLGKGAHKGQGMILREYGAKGPTGRMIQWHPGGGHHGSSPYWKVSSGTGTVRIF